MPPVLTKNEDVLEVALASCRGSAFQDAKEKVKEVPGRRWDPESKNWLVPATPQNADRLLKTLDEVEADDELVAWVRESMTHAEESLTNPLPEDAKGLKVPWAYKRMPWQPEVVNDEKFEGLLPYQRAGVEAMGDRSVLADDMGLGKTLQAISAIAEYQERYKLADNHTVPEGPKLVICPSSVMGSWARELNRWLDEPKVVIIDGKKPADKRSKLMADAIADDAWIIVNWEQIRLQKKQVKTNNGGKRTVKAMKEPLFETTEWLAVIADEVHKAKNPNAQAAQGLWRCQGKVMYGLTGTPIMNSPDELWSVLRWLWPDDYHDRGAAHKPGAQAFWAFYNTYVDYYEDHHKRKVITGVKNPDALRFILRGKLIRRTAAILGLKGRKRIRYPLPLNPEQQKLYDEAERSMWLAVEKDALAGNKEAIAFARAAIEAGDTVNLLRIPNGAARLVRLRQVLENSALLGGPDDSAGMDDFEEKFEDSGFDQWVVFCLYQESCSILRERLRRKFGDDAKVAIYNGSVDKTDRTKIEDAFQRGEINVIVGTIEAMYQGITLTSGNKQFWLSRDFVEVKNKQGEARNDRLGQQEQVFVYIPEPTGTVSVEKVAVANRLKGKIEATVLPTDKIEEVTA